MSTPLDELYPDEAPPVAGGRGSVPLDQRPELGRGPLPSAHETVDDATKSAWDRWLGFVGLDQQSRTEYGQTAAAWINPRLGAPADVAMDEPGARQRRNISGLGFINAAVLEPVQGVLGLPGSMLGARLGTEQAENWVARFQVGLLTSAEEQALEAGINPEQIRDSYNLGNFIGFTAPMVASVKGASMLLRQPRTASIGAHISEGTLIHDMTAGLIFGAAFKPADSLGERVDHALHESAMFGVGRIVLNGLAMPLRAYRWNRVNRQAANEELTRLMSESESGVVPVIQDAISGQRLMSLLSEEGFVSSSAGAQELLALSADEGALVKAIADIGRARATGGRIEFGAGDQGLISEALGRFRQQFPALKFEALKHPETKQWEVFFGEKGLNNRQRMQYKQWGGRFEGQRYFYENAEVTFVGPASRPDYGRFSTSDGAIKEFKFKNTSALPNFDEPFVAAPEIDALWQDFEGMFDVALEQASNIRGGISEEQLIRAIRAGQLKLDDSARRAFNSGGAIVNPEELGLALSPDGIMGITFKPAAGAVHSYGASRALVLRNASKGTNYSERAWRVSLFDADGVPIGHTSAFNTIEEAVEWAGSHGFEPSEVTRQLASADDVTRMFVQKGYLGGNILDPPPMLTFEQVFDRWAIERGIAMAPEERALLEARGSDLAEQLTLAQAAGNPADDLVKQLGEVQAQISRGAPVDINAVRANFAARMRRSMWDAVPAEDRAVFEGIRDSLNKLIDEGKVPFEALAHNRGFHVERFGQQVELREINTGKRFRFKDENTAIESIRSVVRDERDTMMAVFGLDSFGMPSFSGGFKPSDGIVYQWEFTPTIVSQAFKDSIPQRVLRNTRDWLLSIENMSGVPLFTKGFSMIDEGVSRMRARYDPWAVQIQQTWKGVSRESKDKIVRFWTEIEGRADVNAVQAIEMARAQGLTEKEIGTWIRARAIFDEGYKLMGLNDGRYIHHYYARVKPWVEQNNATDFGAIFGDTIPGEFRFFAEMARTGELAMKEGDPEIVMHKYFRSLFFSQEVKPHWDRLAQLVDRGYGKYKKPALKIGDLPTDQQAALMAGNPHIRPEDPVLAEPIRKAISEYLTIIRGNPGEGLETLRGFNRKFFSALGVKADDRVMEEWFNTWMTNMYGSAMAARPALVARNMTQTIWNAYPRLGSRHMNSSMKAAMTQEGFNEALESGAIRMAEAGIPYADAIFEHVMDSGMASGTGAFSNAIAAAVRSSLRLGHVSRKVAEKLLIPYSSGEQMSRAWTFHWFKEHAARHLDMYERRAIGWDKFLDDGLPMFSKPIREEFANMYQKEGRERALRWIGKQGADETHFIYGVGAQPMWMQRPLGRLFGMFGTWPLWASELYGRRVWSGNKKQIAAFTIRTMALTAAFANMSIQSGVDMWNWISPLGTLGWAGGPMADHAINTKRIVDAPVDQKLEATKRLATNLGRLSFPGQLFFMDVAEAIGDNDDPRDQFLRLMVGRPLDRDNYSMRFLYSGDDDPGQILFKNPDDAVIALQDPYREKSLDGAMPFMPLDGIPLPSKGRRRGGGTGFSESFSSSSSGPRGELRGTSEP